VYYNLANALYQQGKSEEAIENYKKAIEINPNLNQAHYNLAIALKNQRIN
jgi:tetratricopeptide (TPR) repeat protein